MVLIIRRQPVPIHSHYQDYKCYLREDFRYSCAYCSIHENEIGGPRNYDVEHFRPQSRFKHLVTVYDNLMYSCKVCNPFKGDDWPSNDPLNDGKGYLNPCEQDYNQHFFITEDFNLEGQSAPARYMIERLHLNRPQLRKIRRKRFEQEDIYHQTVSLYKLNLSVLEQRINDESRSKEERYQFEAMIISLRKQYETYLQMWEKRWEPEIDPSDYR